MPESHQPLQTHDPRRLGSYELTGRLGSGGQGTVFLGIAPDGRRVAVKLLRVQFDDDDTARARFIREAAVAQQVARFCTAQILDADVAGANPYLVSEYVPGPALSRQVSRDGPIGGGALERLAVSTASALAAIHRAGIVHRDLKPHNVLLGPDGPRVIDFGLSRVLDAASAVSSRAVGTPAYMAPEQVAGEHVGAPADVFSWGATMTFAATGTPPFGADNIPAVIYRVLHHEPELGNLDGELRELVEAALSKDPAHRPNAAQLLLRLVGHEDAFESVAAAATDPQRGDPGPVPAPVQRPEQGPPDEDTRPGGAATTHPGRGGPPSAPDPDPDPAGAEGGPPSAGETALDGVPGPGGAPAPARPGTRRRRGRGLAAGIAAALVAALGGAGAYAFLDGRGSEPQDRTGALTSPGATSPGAGPRTGRTGRGKATGTGTGRTARRSGAGSTPGRNTPGPGNGTRPGGGGGDDPPPSSDPPPSPIVLGSPDPGAYCAQRSRTADFRSSSWYCKPAKDDIGVDTQITMAQVCAEQYPGSEARLNGDAGTPGDWDCYVMR